MVKINRRRALIAGVVLLILLPFFITCASVIQHAVNVPFMDDWETVRLFQKVDAHTLSIADLWQQHNEHRIFFINLITVTLGSLTHWHQGVLMMVSEFFVLIALAALCAYAWPEVRKRPIPGVIGLFLISALLFSLGQWENWVRAFQLQWFLCIAAGVLALYILDARTTFASFRVRYGLAIACCVVSSYSLGSGIFFWATCLVPLVIQKRPRLVIEGWILAALACLALYFYHYTFLENSAVGVTLGEKLQFFFAYLGNVFTYNQEIAVVLGVMLVGLAVIAVWYARRVRRLPWTQLTLPLGLMIFSLLSDAVTTESRATFQGAFGAVNSKYATVSTLLVVALVLLFIQVYRAKHNAGPALVMVIVLPLLWAISLHGLGKMRDMQQTLTAVGECLHAPTPTQACLASAHPSPGKVAENLPILKRKHLAGF